MVVGAALLCPLTALRFGGGSVKPGLWTGLMDWTVD